MKRSRGAPGAAVAFLLALAAPGASRASDVAGAGPPASRLLTALMVRRVASAPWPDPSSRAAAGGAITEILSDPDPALEPVRQSLRGGWSPSDSRCAARVSTPPPDSYRPWLQPRPRGPLSACARRAPSPSSSVPSAPSKPLKSHRFASLPTPGSESGWPSSMAPQASRPWPWPAPMRP